MASLHFLFPNDLLVPRAPDELFREQMTVLAEARFSTSLLPEGAVAEGLALRGIPAGARVVYRGWMLRPEEYRRLADAIEAAGGAPFTTPEQYVTAHYLPNWYPRISDLTPETRAFPADADLVRELQALGWDAYFVKDYVKSLKTARGSVVRDPAELPGLLAEMRKYRGEIEGGVCVRRVEDLLPETERRYFVVEGRAYASEVGEDIPEGVLECARRIESPFFSVDVAQRRDGVFRVVEVGDGQVSDLVGWSPQRFAQVWAQHSTD